MVLVANSLTLTHKNTMKPALQKSLLHTGHCGSMINDSLKFSGHSHFELFFAVERIQYYFSPALIQLVMRLESEWKALYFK